MCKATMAIVKGKYKEASVLEIDTDGKPIYALSNVHFGVYQEVKNKIDEGKYWLFGPWKKKFAFLWRTVRNWPPTFNISLSCTPKVAGDTTNLSGENTEMTTDNFSIYLQEDVDSGTDPVLLVQKRTNGIARMDFVRLGWEWIENKLSYTAHEMSETVECREVSVRPSVDDDSSFYDIDGEVFDARPITVRIDPRRVKVFCNIE